MNNSAKKETDKGVADKSALAVTTNKMPAQEAAAGCNPGQQGQIMEKTLGQVGLDLSAAQDARHQP